ncbi:MAG: aromatic ring-hydroxylating oxygenase subunit alpha [Gammaproteobacteria bacterium WSBS_2016_MAG_OTU1]
MPESIHRYLQEDTYANTRAGVEEARTIIPEAYYDADFFALEQKQVFARNWTVAGPASRVKNVGDIMLATIAGQAVFITRDEDGELRAFYNVCRHRGTRLCSQDGNVKKHIVCPYHGWGYNLRGECVGTPLFDKGDNRRAVQMHDMSHLKSFDKKDFGLFTVRVQQWGMLIFVCLDETAPPLEDVIGDLPQRLANYRLDEWEELGERHYDIQCNWKLLFENAVEYYHLPWVHPRLAKTSRIADHHRWQGTGMYCGICTSPVTATDDSGWLSMKNITGLNKTEQISGYFFGLFPNVIIFIMPSHAFVINACPQKAGHTVEKAWLIAHPECVKGMPKKSINEVLEFWNDVNLEDVGICEKVQQGVTQTAYRGGRMCYHFEEPVHRFQNMIIDSMVGVRRIPQGDKIAA